MTFENNPFEMGLDRLVDFNMAGECISMEALRRIRAKGVTRRIVGVELDGDPFPALNFTKWPAHARGGQVGKVTSAIYSPRLRKNIGYCWLPVGLGATGTVVEVESEWGRRSATVVPMPFVDPEKRIPVS
ncbi:MAG: glycine cleavage system protein T, partial [Gemmatimonadota bacterium]|nr:glycine cleavage system protein T [Gemmatimonadota bacterium]